MAYGKGFCRGCGAPCAANRCPGCNAARREEERAQREHRRAHGLCLTCGKRVAKRKMADGTTRPAKYCRKHLAYYAARRLRKPPAAA